MRSIDQIAKDKRIEWGIGTIGFFLLSMLPLITAIDTENYAHLILWLFFLWAAKHLAQKTIEGATEEDKARWAEKQKRGEAV